METELKHVSIPGPRIKQAEIFLGEQSPSRTHRLLQFLKFYKKEKIGFLQKLWLLLKEGVRFAAWRRSPGELYDSLSVDCLEMKLAEIEKEIEMAKANACPKTNEKYMQILKRESINALEGTLYNRKRDFERAFTKENYKTVFPAFVKRYPIVLSSTYSLLNCVNNNFLFDYIIVDEASQADMSGALLTLGCAVNAVVVGDEKQLPQIDDDDFRNTEFELSKKYGVPDAYRYFGNNLLSSFNKVFAESVPSTLLREHYRCNPKIIGFSNERFYDNQLILLKPVDDQEKTPVEVVITAPGHHARKNPYGSGLYNQREISEVIRIVNESPYKSISVISPYRYQANLLQNALGERAVCDTVHRFQGREADMVVFSSTANDCRQFKDEEGEMRKAFVDNNAIINVALTRAKKKFVLVTSDEIAHAKSGVLPDLCHYIFYQAGGVSSNGKVKSIFDSLYIKDSNEVREAREKTGNRNGFASEALLEALIIDVLKEGQYKTLSYASHVSLRELINLDNSKENYEYLSNPWTHVDFVIYNRFDKMPCLLIELDGVAFHEKRKRQLERDAMKDKAIKEAGLHLLRLKTNGDSERKIIKECLDNILKN